MSPLRRLNYYLTRADGNGEAGRSSDPANARLNSATNHDGLYGARASAGIIGAILGAALGALLASQLNNLMPIIGVLLDGAALPVAIEPLQVIVIALVAMAIALLSTLYPSWRAAATQPAEALRYE